MYDIDSCIDFQGLLKHIYTPKLDDLVFQRKLLHYPPTCRCFHRCFYPSHAAFPGKTFFQAPRFVSPVCVIRDFFSKKILKPRFLMLSAALTHLKCKRKQNKTSLSFLFRRYFKRFYTDYDCFETCAKAPFSFCVPNTSRENWGDMQVSNRTKMHTKQLSRATFKACLCCKLMQEMSYKKKNVHPYSIKIHIIRLSSIGFYAI